jgi:glycosyltransferase involved in cell wall biosynthesis
MVSDVYFPRVNGVSTSIQTSRGELRELGHEVHLIAPDYYAPADDETHILRVPSRTLPLDPEDRAMRTRFVWRELAALREEKFDLVHIQTPFIAHYLGVALGKALGAPCVASYHTYFEEYLHHYVPLLPQWLGGYLARAFSRRQCAQLDGLVVPSEPMLERLDAYGINARSVVIPTGLQPDRFIPGDGAAFRAAHRIAAETPVLLCVGRVAHEKNIDFLIRMMDALRHSVPDALLVVAGEGPARGDLEELTSGLGLQGNVRFIGYLDRHRELLDCYRAADLFVFASRTETQGLVLLEAMAQAVPLVSTAKLGARSVLKEGEGVHIAEEDIGEFAAKVRALLADGDGRRRLGERGRTYAHGWSARAQAVRLAEFYADVVGEYRRDATAVIPSLAPGS